MKIESSSTGGASSYVVQYRLRNSGGGAYLYTVDPTERDAAIASFRSVRRHPTVHLQILLLLGILKHGH